MNVTAENGKVELLDRVGARQEFGAYVAGMAFLGEGALAVALGDGRVVFIDGVRMEVMATVPVHDGACLSLAPAIDGCAVFTGGDDGRLVRTDVGGKTGELISAPGQWLDSVVVSPVSGFCAAASGNIVQLFAADGAPVATFSHPFSVGGLAFSPQRQRLAVAHYGGVSLWWAKSGKQEVRLLNWKGSHLALTWSPDGKYIITAMQDRELHGWRFPGGTALRMSGYPTKVKSMSWLPKGRYLATSGAESIVCWPFHGKGGPMGQPPLELGWGFGCIATVVAAHPRYEVIAAGYEDGAVTLVQVGRTHPVLVKRPGDGAVTALAWSADGRYLALGTEGGLVAGLGLSDWRAPQA